MVHVPRMSLVPRADAAHSCVRCVAMRRDVSVAVATCRQLGGAAPRNVGGTPRVDPDLMGGRGGVAVLRPGSACCGVGGFDGGDLQRQSVAVA